MSKGQVLLQLLPTEIQRPVLEPELLGRELVFRAPVDGDHRRAGLPQALQLLGAHLHVSGRQVGVARAFRAQLLRPIGPERHLHQAATVPEVHEEKSSQVPSPVHPSRQRYAFPGARGVQTSHHGGTKGRSLDLGS